MFLWAEAHLFDYFSRFRFDLASLSLAEFKECFSLYDKKQKGKIDAKDLITVMRCLGTSPTTGETERHLQVHKIGAAHADIWNQEGRRSQTEHPSVLFCCIETHLCPVIVFRKDWWAGLLHLSDHDAQTDPTGRPQDWNPGGLSDVWQAEERLYPGIGAQGQTDHVRREADQ